VEGEAVGEGGEVEDDWEEEDRQQLPWKEEVEEG